jgi:glycosyltransferase involved in cell wall biosynthesis
VRVLILNERDPEHPKAGGAEVHVAEIFRRLAARGFEVTQVACHFSGAPREALVEGMQVRRLGRIPGYYLRAAGFCARETRRNRFDLVVECLNKLPFYAPLYSAAPVLAICHHLFGETAFQQVPWPVAATVWTAERLIPRIYRSIPFVAISESTRNDLVARSVPGPRIRVIHCGIRRPEIELPAVTARPLRLAYLGRLEPYKRIDALLHAMPRVAERFPEVELVIIGRGPDRERLERIAAAAGVTERTRFTGFVSDAERDALLAATRVCVCPSRKEGWGLTVIEANALGVPVVATDAPGLRDSVRHDETGLLVPDGAAGSFSERLARAISDLLGDEARLARLSSGGLGWSQRFDWDVAAREMADALGELAGARGSVQSGA